MNKIAHKIGGKSMYGNTKETWIPKTHLGLLMEEAQGSRTSMLGLSGSNGVPRLTMLYSPFSKRNNFFSIHRKKPLPKM
jgi:hypothetical protein